MANFYKIFNFLGYKGLLNWMTDKTYLKLRYKACLGKKLNLTNPQTFNEKLQWLKLYNRKPVYTMMVDKYLVRDYIREKLGEEYLIPLLGVWDSPDEIDFDALPNKFVLKCNHNSGLGMYICKDKSKIDVVKVRNDLRKGLAQDYYLTGREWPYKEVPRKIIAEQYMTDNGLELYDYKVHNFNGVPKVILVCRDHFKGSSLTEDFYSDKWEHLDVKRPEHFNAGENIKRPEELEEMLELSCMLSKDTPFVRTDFYTINHKIYLGELTFYPESGFAGFVPEKWGKTLSDWLIFPVERGIILNKNNSYILITNEDRAFIKDKKEEGLTDYKFFCFNGRVKCFKIDFDRFTDHRANYYSPQGELLPFGEVICLPNFEKKLPMPRNLTQMIELAEKLSSESAFLRVDFYEVSGKIYFGELTFYPASGFGKFEPEEWNYTLGSWLTLPKI